MLRADANRCRFAPEAAEGHYESYFLRANHPKRALAFWIRYTFFIPQGRVQDATGELWAVYFDGEDKSISAARTSFPMAACRIGRATLDLAIGAARLGDHILSGAATCAGRSLAWRMSYTAPQAPLMLQPEAMYERPFPRAKVLVPAPGAVFSGSLRLDGTVIEIDRWTGSQNHNWGSRHTDAYAWGQVAGFDGAPDVFLECATARLKIGFMLTPPLTLVVLRIGALEFSLNSVTQAVRTRAHFDFFYWEIDAQNADVRITVSIRAPRQSFVGLDYPNPPGGSKTCLNSKLASCVLTVEQRGQRMRSYASGTGAAFEILTDRSDHGVTVLARECT
jgi:hypothetical protein